MAGEVGTAYVDVAFNDGQVDKSVGGLGSRIRGSLGTAGKAAGLALGAGIALAGVGIKTAIGDASDLNESISKATQTFEKSAPKVQAWSKTTATSLGLSRQAALEGASSIGAMLKPMGIAPQAASGMSTSMVQLAADMASFNNEDPTDMLDRIRAGLSGESEPLKKFGTVLSETRVQQFAWANGIAKSGAALTEQQKIMGRYGLLLQDTKDQQGDFARTSEGLANQQRILKAELADASAQLGQALLPAAIAVVHTLVELVPHVIAFGQSLIDGVTPAVLAVAGVVQQYWPAIKETIVGAVAVVTAVIDALRGTTTSSTSEMSGSMQGVRAVAEVVFKAIGAVVSEVRLVFERVASGIRAHSDEIRATMQSLKAIFEAVWPAISKIVQAAWSVIKIEVDTALKVVGAVIRAVMAVIRGDWDTAWKELGGAVKALLSGVVQILKAELLGLAPAVLGLAVKVGAAIVKGIGNGLLSLAGLLATQLARIPVALANAAGNAATAAAHIGLQIVQGVLSGVGGLFGQLKSKLESDLRGVLSSISPFSPVAKGAEVFIGRELGRGAILGWVIGSADLPEKLAEGVRNAVERARSAIDASKGRLSDAWGALGGDLLRAFDAAWNEPTKAEAEIARLEAEATSGRLESAIADARARLAAAQAGDDPAAVVAAQKALDDALLQQHLAALHVQAEQERRERDAEIELKRRHFEEDLAALQTRLAKQGATHAQAQKAVLALMRKYGIEYGEVGAELGSSFVRMLEESLEGAVDAAVDVANRVEAALARIRAAQTAAANVKKPKGVAPAGVAAAGVGPLGADVTGPGPLAAGGLGGSGLAGPVSPTRELAGAFGRALAGVQGGDTPASLEGLEVNVFVGDEPLRGIVRHEVVRHDAGVARVLMAGAA